MARSMCAGSSGASQGAKIAQMTKKITKITPIVARGLRRARWRMEMAGAEFELIGVLLGTATVFTGGVIVM